MTQTFMSPPDVSQPIYQASFRKYWRAEGIKSIGTRGSQSCCMFCIHIYYSSLHNFKLPQESNMRNGGPVGLVLDL